MNGRHASPPAPDPDETPDQTILRLQAEADAARAAIAAHQVSVGGLPMWVTVTVVLLLAGLFAWNIVVNGPDGLGLSYVIGGLLGAYSGVDHLVRRRRNGGAGGQGDDQGGVG